MWGGGCCVAVRYTVEQYFRKSEKVTVTGRRLFFRGDGLCRFHSMWCNARNWLLWHGRETSAHISLCICRVASGPSITKTCLYNFDRLRTHFYIVKLGFTGVYIIFLISAKHIECGYSLERGGSNEYPQSMFWAEKWKNIRVFIRKFSVFGGEISRYFDKRVFVMLVACGITILWPFLSLFITWFQSAKFVWFRNIPHFRLRKYEIWRSMNSNIHWFGFYGPQEIFTCIEPIVHQRSAQTGKPGEKAPDHPSHMWPKRGSNHSGEKPNGLIVNFSIH